MLRIVAACALALSLQHLHAGELLNAYVNEIDDHYILHLDMRVDADYDSVYEVLMDFSKMMEVNNSITSSRLLESDDKIHKLHFVSEGCILSLIHI